MSEYKDTITAAMTELGRDPRTRFIGYGVSRGRAMGTLSGVPADRLVETPVAENLMCGLATGMALAGLLPIVYYERFDFVLNAADAIVNHLDKVEAISSGEFSAGVIIRVTVGNRAKPLFTGATHVQDLTSAFQAMLKMPVVSLTNAQDVRTWYELSATRMLAGQSTMLVEHKDLM